MQFYLRGFLHRILNSSVFSFQEFISLNVSTFLLFLCWYAQFIKFLQVFIYLITYPQGICFYLHNTLSTLRYLHYNLFSVKWKHFVREVFSYSLRALLELSLPKKNFSSTKFVFTESHKFFNIFSFSLPLDSTRGCRAKVWYRTRNTPARLGFAPEDSQPCEPWCRCSCLFPPGWCHIFFLFLLLISIPSQWLPDT